MSERRRPAARSVEVLRTERLSPSLVRVVFGGEDLADYPGSEFTDSYVKLVFPVPGVTYEQPLDMGAIKKQHPHDEWPVVRTYSVRSWDADTRELSIDFVVHGDSGVAGPWAARAVAGDRILLNGPGGAYSPDPALDAHLLLGDESALPAIASALDSLPADAQGSVIVEFESAESVIPISAPAGVQVTTVITAGRVGDVLVAAAKELQLDGEFDAFVHGEAGFVKELRTWLRADKQVDRTRLSVSGYWRLGNTEDGWRDAKAQWNAEAEAAEKAAGVKD